MEMDDNEMVVIIDLAFDFKGIWIFVVEENGVGFYKEVK